MAGEVKAYGPKTQTFFEPVCGSSSLNGMLAYGSTPNRPYTPVCPPSGGRDGDYPKNIVIAVEMHSPQSRPVSSRSCIAQSSVVLIAC